MQKIYIAGPDVFEPDSIEIGKKYSKLCGEYGFVGMYPLDNSIDFDQPKQKVAHDIFKANEELIKKADIVIANINAFRGKEADSGTVWECGYAYGLGKKVYGYMNKKLSYIEHFSDKEKRLKGAVTVDTDGKMIEDFDYPVNLMIACSVIEIVEGGFEDVLKKISTL
ncbi:nucleoside 2-deoxyribosyltransferase [bacterium]|nr:nucleoside 2-deoxyribosyltransferase [bacterium]MBU1990428.1 nucleoside 2-deoxyribosyltransferase [bacterium]